jgi:N-glycosylase/DNA lyase
MEAEVLPTEKKMDTLVRRARHLADAIDQSYLELANILSALVRYKYPESIGYQGKEGFERFLAEKIGIRYRKARYLIGIADAIESSGLDEDKVREIGWVKAKELAGLPAEDAVRLLEYAQDATLDEVKAVARQLKGQKPPPATVTFSVHPDQAEIINTAISKAKLLCKTESPAHALEMICGEWLAECLPRHT